MNNKIDEKKYLANLKNRIWKLLPIFEGRGINQDIIYDKSEAFKKYTLYLDRLSTELSGAKSINKENGYYAELYFLLEGMKEFTINDHDKVRDVILHCCSLCEKLEVI